MKSWLQVGMSVTAALEGRNVLVVTTNKTRAKEYWGWICDALKAQGLNARDLRGHLKITWQKPDTFRCVEHPQPSNEFLELIKSGRPEYFKTRAP